MSLNKRPSAVGIKKSCENWVSAVSTKAPKQIRMSFVCSGFTLVSRKVVSKENLFYYKFVAKFRDMGIF